MAGGKQYYYCPFPKHDDRNTKLTAEKYDKKLNCTIIHPKANTNGLSRLFHVKSKEKTPLAQVEDDATLIIMAHGSAENSRIGVAGKGNTWLALTCDQLANQLKLEGLPKSHCKIRLLSCYGSGVAKGSETHRASFLDGQAVFACQLAMKLGALGYKNICVAGYKGPAVTCVAGRTKVRAYYGPGEDDWNHELASLDKSNRITWYNATGEETAKPGWQVNRAYQSTWTDNPLYGQTG